MTRKQIAEAFEVLAKMVKDGDETTIETEEARRALAHLSLAENFQEPK